MARVAFIGLGNMGGPMAANLVKAGHTVVGYDVAQEVCTTAAGKGIHIADTVEAAIGDADVIMTMLPNGDLVRSVWARAVPAARKGALIIDSSTIDVNSARGVHDCARAAGLLSLDAPVSGGTEGAVAGTLTFMVGGDESSYETGRPLLSQMGRRIVHCGAAGNGQAAKICNNMILGVTMIAVSEAFNLAEQVGLSHQALFDVASSSSGQCYALTTHCPAPGPVPTAASNRGYTPGFASELMLKDLGLAQEAAGASRSLTPLGSLAQQLYRLHCQNGNGKLDFSSVKMLIAGS